MLIRSASSCSWVGRLLNGSHISQARHAHPFGFLLSLSLHQPKNLLSPGLL